jgi:citrate synthase
LDLPSDPGAARCADAAGFDELGLRLVAQLPTAVAAYARLREGRPPIAPDPELSHAANYLYMLTGEAPSAQRIRALETYLNTVCDNGLNASTFTARVIMATRSDLVSAITGAIGALKGPLHGGAPGPVLDMLDEIRAAGDVDAILRRKIEAGERLMGFGHRVFKVRDPRAPVLAAAAAELYGAERDTSLYQLACQVEERAVALLEQHKPGRNLQTNVEFFTALVLNGVGLARDLFTPTFAVGRVAGWIAHCFEQRDVDRLIRPDAVYVGASHRDWVPLEQR